MKIIVLLVLVFQIIFPHSAASQIESRSEAEAQVPRGFRNIELGMELERAKELLREDPYFDYRGDPDVSFLPQTFQTLIECEGNSFVKRAFFQFSEEKLVVMILVLDQKKIDHYSVFTALTERWGPFTSLTPFKVTWDFPDVLLALERPLSVKYIDRKVYEKQLEEGEAEESLRKSSRDRFLENF